MDISLDWLNQHKPGNTAKFFNLEFLEKIDDTFKIKVTFPPESTNPMNMAVSYTHLTLPTKRIV